MLKKTIALGFASLLLASPAWAAPDWSAVDRAIGRAGAEQPGGVHRYSFPRSDLSVTLDGVTIKPSLALQVFTGLKCRCRSSDFPAKRSDCDS